MDHKRAADRYKTARSAEIDHSGVPAASLVLPSMEPGQPVSNMHSLSAVLVAHCPPSRCLNEVAPQKVRRKTVALDTSQSPIGALKEVAL